MNITLANALQQFRRERALSQQALATKLFVSVATVARWERGTTTPSTLALLALRRVGFRAGSVI